MCKSFFALPLEQSPEDLEVFQTVLTTLKERENIFHTFSVPLPSMGKTQRRTISGLT